MPRVLGKAAALNAANSAVNNTSVPVLQSPEQGASQNSATLTTNSKLSAGIPRTDSPSSELSVDTNTSTVTVATSTSTSSSTEDEVVEDMSDILKGSHSTSTSTSAIQCPICQETMISLLQLNRHLDDVHSGKPQSRNASGKPASHRKNTSTNIQPNSPTKLRHSQHKSNGKSSNVRHSSSVPFEISTSHYQPTTGHDQCKVCRRGLNIRAGVVNCRHCGKLCCSNCTRFEMKLNKRANHDPEAGIWSRVCEHCYMQRPGFSLPPQPGSDRDLTSQFTFQRSKHINQRQMESNRLEQRLMTLIEALDGPSPATSGPVSPAVMSPQERPRSPFTENPYFPSSPSPLSNAELNNTTNSRPSPSPLLARSQSLGGFLASPSLKTLRSSFPASPSLNIGMFRKSIEKRVTLWQDDKQVAKCPLCTHSFNYTLRKHHCRICGRVVCGDAQTQCSLEIPVSILKEKLLQGQDESSSAPNSVPGSPSPMASPSPSPNLTNLSVNNVLYPRPSDNSHAIRVCRDCKDTMFARRNFQYQTHNEPTPELIKVFLLLDKVRHNISSKLLREFEDSLLVVENPQLVTEPNSSGQNNHRNPSAARKKLMDAFVQYDTLAKRIGMCHVESTVEKRLQSRMMSVAEQFLQDTMVPLRAVPKVLKKSIGSDLSDNSSINSGGSNNNGNYSYVQFKDLAPDSQQYETPSKQESQLDRMSRRTRLAAETKLYQDQLIVLQEQEYLVRNMMEDAKKSRRFDEVAPLLQSVEELQREISKIESLLAHNADA